MWPANVVSTDANQAVNQAPVNQAPLHLRASSHTTCKALSKSWRPPARHRPLKQSRVSYCDRLRSSYLSPPPEVLHEAAQTLQQFCVASCLEHRAALSSFVLTGACAWVYGVSRQRQQALARTYARVRVTNRNAGRCSGRSCPRSAKSLLRRCASPYCIRIDSRAHGPQASLSREHRLQGQIAQVGKRHWLYSLRKQLY